MPRVTEKVVIQGQDRCPQTVSDGANQVINRAALNSSRPAEIVKLRCRRMIVARGQLIWKSGQGSTQSLKLLRIRDSREQLLANNAEQMYLVAGHKPFDNPV